MTSLWILIGVGVVFIYILVYALFESAKRHDKQIEKFFKNNE